MPSESTTAVSRARTLAIATIGASLAVGLCATVAHAAPPAAGSKSVEPSLKPATKDDLSFRPGTLTLVTDPQGGQRYWVFTYQVANKTGKTQRFSPRFELLMGDGTILEGGAGVPPEVAVRMTRTGVKPGARDQFQIIGDILDGEANAQDGFVIWAAKGDAKDITLFVTGTSAAFDRATDPATGKESYLRRTWTRDYTLPGVADPRSSVEATPVAHAGEDARWIMR